MKHLFFSLFAAFMLTMCLNSNDSVVKNEKIEYAQYKKKKAKTVKVKSHNRKAKSGKVSRVRSHKRSKG